MADNLSAYKSSSQTTLVGLLAFDECTINATAVQVPRSKLGFGADGTYSEVASDNPFPVYLASAGTLPSGAATAANQSTGNTSLATIAGAVSGTEMQVDVLTMPTVAVTGTFWQATQPVSIAAAVAVTDNGGSLTVDGTVTANAGTGTFTVTGSGGTFPVTDSGGSLTVDAPVGTPVFVRLSDGSSAISTLPVSVAAAVAVTDNSGSLTVDNAGTFAVQATQSGTWNVGAVTTVSTVSLNSDVRQSTASNLNAQVVGSIAHDAVDSGNPIKIGGKALSSAPAAVASGDRTDAWYDLYGRLAVTDIDPETGLGIGTTGLRDRTVAQRYTVLADSLADGLAGFWTTTTANGGTAASTGGEGLLQTSTGATGSAQLSSSNVIYFPGQVGWFNSAVRFGDTGGANNTRRIGVYTVSGTTPQDGFYYELNGTTLNAVVCKAGTPTATASTSWSRVTDAPFTLDTNYHSFEIRYTANTVWFYVDNVLRHRVSGTSSSITATLDFPITIHTVNTSGSTNRTIAVRNCGIGRFGCPAQPVAETGLSAVHSLAVGGGTPHDSVDSGNPLKLGGRAQATAPTAVADGDRVNAWFTQSGALNIADGAGSITVDGTVAATQSGTWNVTNISGTVSLPTGAATESTLSTLNGKVTACNTGAVVLAAGTALAGRVSASDETSTIYNGTTALTPKFATIAASSSGNNAIVAAVTSKKIRVLQYMLIGNGAVNAKFQSGAGGTDLTGLHYIAAAGGGASAPYSPVGLFETASGALLNLNLSGAVAVGGWISYVEV